MSTRSEPWQPAEASRNPSNVASIRRRSSGLAHVPILKTVIYLAFLLLIAVIPFESVDLGNGKLLTLTRIAGYLFVLVALLRPRFSFRQMPQTFVCFAIYLVLIVTMGVRLSSSMADEFASYVWKIGQLVILFWISYNLMREPRWARNVIVTFVVSCSLLAVLQRLGVTSVSVESTLGDRVTALQENANTFGMILSLAAVALVGLAISRSVPKWQQILAIPFGLLLLAGVVATGSRGAMLALAVGLVAFLLRPGSVWLKARSIVMVATFGLLLVRYIASNDVSRLRWEKTVAQGSLATREEIYPQAWQMFLEEPLVGWGPVKHRYELGARIGSQRRDTHNVILWVLTEGGLIGAAPFLLGLWLCIRMAWVARAGPHGVLPLALVMTLMINNMSGTESNRKIFWIVLAYAAACGAQAAESKRARDAGHRQHGEPTFERAPRSSGTVA